jgi:hypothetical protein
LELPQSDNSSVRAFSYLCFLEVGRAVNKKDVLKKHLILKNPVSDPLGRKNFGECPDGLCRITACGGVVQSKKLP